MQSLDLTQYRCPMAFVQAKLAMRSLNPGESIELLLSDPATLGDLSTYARRSGFQVVMRQRSGTTAVILSPTP